jgi:hypothetical protein
MPSKLFFLEGLDALENDFFTFGGLLCPRDFFLEGFYALEIFFWRASMPSRFEKILYAKRPKNHFETNIFEMPRKMFRAPPSCSCSLPPARPQSCFLTASKLFLKALPDCSSRAWLCSLFASLQHKLPDEVSLANA